MAHHPAPKKSLGQHFLFDRSILAKIVKASGLSEGEAALEIGPGPGGLTKAILEAGGNLWAVEADPRMVEHLRGGEFSGLKVIHADALKTDYLALAAEAGSKMRLIANLPYNISGPLLARLLRQRAAFSSMTLMFQREVAQRIAASEGGRERGGLSVLAQVFCSVKIAMKVPAGAFRPPPKVESAVIRLDVLETAKEPLSDEETLWQLVHEAFLMRRKMLRNCLKERLDEEGEVLAAAGLSGTERPEELSALTWIRLANAVHKRKPPA